jgi:carbamoyltransferase
MYIIGVNDCVHDASTSLVEDGELVCHLNSERISHIKHDGDIKPSLKHLIESYNISPKTVTYNGGVDVNNTHHLFHAFHSFYDSGFEKAVCIVIDGMGSEVVINDSRFLPNTYGRECKSVYVLEYPNKFYLHSRYVSVPFECNNLIIENGKTVVINSISEALAFQKTCEKIGMNWYDAGKLMALASFGKKESHQIYDDDLISNKLFNVSNLTQVQLNLDLNMKDFKSVANFALSLQNQTQEKVRQYILNAVKEINCNNVCLSGGYFLNCVANNYIRKNIKKNINIFVEPISGDDGVSIGAAKVNWYSQTNSKKIFKLKTLYNGPKINCEVEGDYITIKEVSKLLSDRKIVAVFQGRSESGPRALGNRSILYDPTDENGKEKINKIKGREWYRPFAGTVLLDYSKDWFNMHNLEESPYMMYALEIIKDKRNMLPAISHIDYSCRIQTITRKQNINYYRLINEFYNLTGVPILLNTSFNKAGDTMVETLEDALKSFNETEIDYLYFPEKQKIISK